jgi:hypothetical protein
VPSGKTRWQGGSVVRNHYIARAQQVRKLGAGPMLDITPTVSDQHLRMSWTLNWQAGGDHPIAS